MSVRNTVKSGDFDVSLIRFGKMQAMGNKGGKKVSINYADVPLSIQTPKMSAPFGLSKYLDPEDKDSNGPKYSYNLSFNGIEEGNDIYKFRQVIMEVENAFLQYCLKHYVEIFGADDDDDAARLKYIKKQFTSIILPSRDKVTKKPDGKNPDQLRVKINYYENTVNNRDKKPFLMTKEDYAQNGNLDYGKFVVNIDESKPQVVDGKTVYPVTIGDFAKYEIYEYQDGKRMRINIMDFIPNSKMGEAIHIINFMPWMVSGKLGIKCTVVQTMAYPKQQMSGYYIELDEENNSAPKFIDKMANLTIANSDSEDEDGDQ
jgi:hypothetical protein